jgi:hypothetical protein
MAVLPTLYLANLSSSTTMLESGYREGSDPLQSRSGGGVVESNTVEAAAVFKARNARRFIVLRICPL